MNGNELFNRLFFKFYSNLGMNLTYVTFEVTKF